MNLLRVRAERGSVLLGGSSFARAPVESGEVLLGLRPNEVELGGAGAEARVVALERLGHQTIVRLRAGDSELLASRAGSCALTPGERVRIAAAPPALHWFDPRDGQRLNAP